MNLRQIEYFLNICECKSISRAAQKMYMETATLSRAMSELEKELGAALFKRTSRGVILTEYGQIVRTGFLQAQSALDSMVENVQDRLREEKKYIPLAIGYGIMHSLSTDMWNNYLHAHEGVTEFRPLDMPDYAAEREVLDRRVDLGFTIGPVDESCFEARLLKRSRMYLILAQTHPLYQKETVCIEDIKHFGRFAYSRSFKSRENIERFCRAHGFEYTSHYESSDLASLIQMSTENRGIFIIPECYADLGRIGVRYVPLPKNELSWDIYMIRRRNEKLPLRLEELWNYCIAFCNQHHAHTLDDK